MLGKRKFYPLQIDKKTIVKLRRSRRPIGRYSVEGSRPHDGDCMTLPTRTVQRTKLRPMAATRSGRDGRYFSFSQKAREITATFRSLCVFTPVRLKGGEQT